MKHLPTFRECVQICRTVHGLTLEELANECGVTTRTIARWKLVSGPGTLTARKWLYHIYIKGTEHDPNHS